MSKSKKSTRKLGKKVVIHKAERAVTGVMLSRTKFKNGATMSTYFVEKPPRQARKAKDHIYVEIAPAKGRGETSGWWMNSYDVANIIETMSKGWAVTVEKRIPPH